jgi:hypothetical protein
MNTTTMTTWPGSRVIQPGIERPTAMRIISNRPGPDGGQPWGLLTTQVPF